MSDERGFGADMVPMSIPDFAVVEVSPVVPIPATEAERHEHVNADTLRRALHGQIDALVCRIRALPVESPTTFEYIPGIAHKAAADIEAAIGRYLDTERKFRRLR